MPLDLFNVHKTCRHGEMLFNRNDLYIGRSLDLYGEFSEHEVELFAALLEPGALVVEVGSNIGAHTVALSRLVGDEGAVLAFEPQRLAFHLLCGNLALNSRINVIAFQKAVGAEAGVLLVPQLNPAVENNFGALSLGAWENGEPVAVISLDGMQLSRLDLIKADVEGMEEQVLAGAAATIAQHRPVLYLEDNRPEKSDSLRARIRSLGYRIYGHTPPLYNPDNFAHNGEDAFPGIVSKNLLCLPRESASLPPFSPYLQMTAL